MIRKFILLSLVCFSLALASCDNESTPTPSMKDVDRIPALLDLGNPTVKEFHDKYGINVLYNFDDNLDFKFQMLKKADNDNWKTHTIYHLDTPAEVTTAFGYFDEMVLSYVNETFRKMMPQKILIARDFKIGESGNPDKYNAECYYPEAATASVVCTPYAVLFSFDHASIDRLSEANRKRSAHVKLYTLICHVIDQHKLYDQVPEEFYAPVRQYYDKNVETMATADVAAGTTVDHTPADKYCLASWYIGKGLSLTMHSPNNLGSLGDFEERVLRENATQVVPNAQRDFRNFVALMLFEPSDKLRTYYENQPIAAGRMKIAIRMLKQWGVDVSKINPDLDTIFPPQ